MANSEVLVEHPPFSISQVLIEFVVLFIKCIWYILESIISCVIPAAEKSVKGEIVLITGAGHGIGRELTLQYASKGATVVCLDINKDGNEETVKLVGQLNYPKAHAYVCNVTNRLEVFSVAEKIKKEVGDVTVLINNAGILAAETLFNSSPEMIERTMNVNVIAHFWTIQAFLPRMLELNRGHIVALSSCAGIVGIKYLVAYSASKFAVRGLMEALRNELRVNPNCNVKVTTIYPHIVNTGLCKKPSIRLPAITPMITPIGAAKHIMSAQRRNIEETSIPPSLFKINQIVRFFPTTIGDALFDFLDIYVKPDS